jgi:predicted SAM-dependent methyltransferase
MKLNLGCGRNKRDGFVNIDKYATFQPDLVWDIEKTHYPFEAGSVTEIAAAHVLEYLGQHSDAFLAIIKELYRVLAPAERSRSRCRILTARGSGAIPPMFDQ